MSQSKTASTDFERTRGFFNLPSGLTYLDGNSLGPPPKNLPASLDGVLNQEWGELLIGAWRNAGWMDKPLCVGDQIGSLIGAPQGTVVTGDTLSVKVYQALGAALRLNPTRPVILTDSGNFPSDLYMAQGLIDTMGNSHRLKIVEPEQVANEIGSDIAVLLLTEVDYRTGRRHDMSKLTRTAQEHGALTVWDLAHSVGAINVNVAAAQADFAVGCTYKYLNGGPGAPAFIYVAEHIAESVSSPLSGWLGHAAPFDFELAYRASPGIGRMRVGTPPIIGLAVLETALEVWKIASINDVAARSVELSQSFIKEVELNCPELELASPRDPEQRGSHVSFRHPEGYAIMQHLIENHVVGDFRDPDIIRFGIAPLYNTESCIMNAVEGLKRAIANRPWESGKYKVRAAVT